MAGMSVMRPSASKGRVSRQQGFSLIELLVAILLLMVGFMAVFTVLWSSTRAGSFSRNMSTAASLGQDMLERAQGLGYDDLKQKAGGFVNYTTASVSAVGFTRERQIIDAGAGVVTIHAKISWETPGKATSTRIFTMTKRSDY